MQNQIGKKDHLLLFTKSLKKKELLHELFGIRQEADYEDFVEIEEEDLKPLIPKIKELIDEIEQIIKEENDH